MMWPLVCDLNIRLLKRVHNADKRTWVKNLRTRSQFTTKNHILYNCLLFLSLWTLLALLALLLLLFWVVVVALTIGWRPKLKRCNALGDNQQANSDPVDRWPLIVDGWLLIGGVDDTHQCGKKDKIWSVTMSIQVNGQQ